MRRECFNRGWVFGYGSGSGLASLFGGVQEEFPVTLPHDMSACLPRDGMDVYASGNGFFQEKTGHYKKSFFVPEEDRSLLWIVEFEGIYQNAFVYVNGSFAGKHPYGYGNFFVDLTPFLRYGSENQLLVIVKNGVPSGRWYTGGGIYRDVWLMKTSRIHLAKEGVRLTTTALSESLATVRAEIGVANQDTGSETLRCVLEIIGPDGTAATVQAPVTLREGETANVVLPVYVSSPELWSPESPLLYRYRAVLLDGKGLRELDSEEGTFGIRTVRTDPINGLQINGRTFKLRGGCIHHDNGIIGAVSTRHSAFARIRALKQAGFNAIRSAHYPIDRYLLEACDHIGMFVMDEFSDVWTTTKVDFDYGIHMSEWWEYDISNMVYKDYNHPSVILYSIGNEIPEVGNRFDTAIGRRIAEKIRNLDGSRPVVNSMNLMLAVMGDLPELLASFGADDTMQEKAVGMEINQAMTNLGELMGMAMGSEFAGRATEEAASQVDVVGLNYAAMRYEPDFERYPNRVMMGSETNPADLDVNWQLVEKLPYVIGDFDWTAWDYLGETGIGAITYGEESRSAFYHLYPYRAAYCGDLNLLGDRRPVSYWREIIWGLRTDPYIAVQHPKHFGLKQNRTQWCFSDVIRSWTFGGYEGCPVAIEVYAAADEVELLLNGKSLGKYPVGEKKKAIAYIEAAYEPGCLEAIAYRNGIATGRDIIRTAKKTTRLSVTTDAESIPADGRDICYVDLRTEDEDGILNMEASMPVHVSVEGSGALLGFGSANPATEENFFDTTAVPYEGRLRAAIRGTGKGTVIVRFSAEGLPDTSVSIRAIQ